MFVDPKLIMFESQKDIVDFVSGGILPPSKSQFNDLMYRVNNPISSELSITPGEDVVITESMVPIDEREVLDRVLRRVYANRVKRRNGFIIFSALALSLYFSRKK